MIQILGIRSFVKDGDEIKYDAFFDKNYRADSVQNLFRDLPKYLEQIPEKDRWNLYYTVANCTASKREFSSQSVIAFDIDHIDQSKKEETIAAVLGVIGGDKATTGIISSGYGLHFLVGLEKPFRNKDFFKLNRHHYRAICEKIDRALETLGLSGKTDPSIFDARRLLRLPGTWNRKPDREDKLCEIINHTIKAREFSLSTLSGIPDVKPGDQVSKQHLKKYPKIDTQAVLEGCNFLKWMKQNPSDVIEPQWYAGLSILARMDHGDKLCHDYSSGHPGYKPEETDSKIKQALEASGPRTCESIDNLWGLCAKCPNYQKVKSPIMLRGEDAIATEYTGFYNVSYTKGGELKLTPNYEDLMKFFAQKHPFISLAGSRMVYVWNGTHYEMISNSTLEAFAKDHMDPSPLMYIAREFREQLCIANERPHEWFSQTTDYKINFRNGVLDLKAMEFLPHSPDRGFRYTLNFDYNPEADCPTYKAMLKRVSGDNPAMVDVLNEAAGFAIIPGPYFPHKAVVLVGEGANGKTTWINTLCALAGSGNYSGLTLLDIQDSEYNRQLIDGKLFNISEETSMKSFADSSMFKRLVGGGIIQVRKPYKDAYEIVNRARMIITCNELPPSYDPTHGFARRLLVIPFNRKFTVDDPDYDPDIEDKLKGELSGIFNEILFAYKRLQKNKRFTECEVVTAKMEEYSLEIDSVKHFIKENVEYFDNGSMKTKFTTISTLYAHYKEMTERGGERPVNVKSFGKRLRNYIKNYDERYCERKLDGKKVRGLWGVDFSEGAGLQLTDVTENISQGDASH